METIEQVNDDFNVKKPKKKGLIIGIVVALVIIIALLLVYFLVFSKPQYIFSSAIDRILNIESKDYDSIKLDSKVKVTVESEDEDISELEELEKCTLEIGAQMDINEKKELVKLGLKYDKDPVLDMDIYYDDGDMYAYFDELFDKYIKIDMEDEQKEQLETIFDTADENTTKEFLNAYKDELKAEIKERGTFEKKQTTIEIGDKEQKVTKNMYSLTDKEAYKIIENTIRNLGENDKLLDNIEKSKRAEFKESMEEIADSVKEEATDDNITFKISIFTKGLFNKIVGVEIETYSADDKSTVIIDLLNEDKDVYSYNVKAKSQGTSVDAIKGKVEIKKDKDSKDEQSGKTIITAEIVDTGKATLEIDYSVEYNKDVDKIDTSNSINMTEMTEEDMQSIMEKLMERPLIGDFITDQMNSLGTEYEDNITDGTDNNTQTLTTSQNEVKDENYGYSVTYSVPAGFEYESNYSYDYSKYYTLEDNDSEIEANVSLGWYTDEEYQEDNIEWDYSYYKDDTTYYKNVTLGEQKTVKVGEKDFKYQILSYESNSEYYNEKYQKVYIWYNLDNEHIFSVELESTDKEISEDIIKGFLNINVKEI